METIRKRSAASIVRQGLTTTNDVECNPIRSHSSASPTRTKRKKPARFLKPDLPTVLLAFGTGCLVYAVSSLAYLAPAEEEQLALYYRTTFDRVLHHDIPFLIDISRGRVVSQQYIPQRPRMIGNYFETANSDSYLGTEPININTFRLRKSHVTIDVSSDSLEAQEDLENSKDYRGGRAERFENEVCKAQYEWQKQSFPTCNFLFEQDLTHLALDADGNESVRLLASGYWRDVWKVQDGQDRTVLKTIRYEHDYEPRNQDRHRRDAMAMEQLTSSQWVMDIYGYCGNSGIFEFADGGSLDDSLDASDEAPWSSSERLVVAFQVASGIAAVHNYPKEGIPAIAHTDITTSQFVYVNSAAIYKLNDFNRCRFIRWDTKRNTTCPFKVGNNPGNFRSPEEYAYEGETEKIDVYSMGNIFYALLTGLWPFEELKSKKAKNLVKKGSRPPIPEAILNTTDMFDQTLLNATRACWIQDPEKRATARQIQKYIESQLIKLGVQKT
jgi:serine/threonine protein kinase